MSVPLRGALESLMWGFFSVRMPSSGCHPSSLTLPLEDMLSSTTHTLSPTPTSPTPSFILFFFILLATPAAYGISLARDRTSGTGVPRATALTVPDP